MDLLNSVRSNIDQNYKIRQLFSVQWLKVVLIESCKKYATYLRQTFVDWCGWDI